MRFFGNSRRALNLALQGGGAHGAFTWGVLDRLLEEPRLEIAAISGTSAGAVNAVALAAGYVEGGAEGARTRLAALWRDINKAGLPAFSRYVSMLAGAEALAASGYQQLTSVLSPYSFNPLDINPLRAILRAHIDFEGLRRNLPFELLIAATAVESGLARIFSGAELTVDVVLASACLPTLYQAVEIDGAHYWDGGFAANPDLVTLARHSRARDTLVVLVNPIRQEGVPRTAAAIAGNIARLTFNQPFLRDVALIDAARRCEGRFGHRRNESALGRDWRALARQRFHLISGAAHTRALSPQSKLKPEGRLLRRLHEAGRNEAEHWLADHFSDIGRRETADLPALFLHAGTPSFSRK